MAAFARQALDRLRLFYTNHRVVAGRRHLAGYTLVDERLDRRGNPVGTRNMDPAGRSVVDPQLRAGLATRPFEAKPGQ